MLRISSLLYCKSLLVLVVVMGAMPAFSQTSSITLTPSSLSFPSTYLAAQATAQTITAKNPTTGALGITLSLTGTNSTDFKISSNKCGTSIAAGKSCAISITFKPTAAGTRVAALMLQDSAGGTNSASLTGIGTNIQLSPSPASFGTVVVGSSVTKIVTLTNHSANPLNIAGISISGDFSLVATANHCAGTIAAGGKCTMQIAFQPTAINARTGTLSVVDDGIGSPQTDNLTGNGTVVSLSPSPLNFGSVGIGSASPTATVTLTNHSSSSLTVSSVGVSGTMQADFVISSQNCTAGVAALSTCQIVLYFQPQATGKRSAKLTVKDNGGGSPQTDTLNGVAVAPVCGNGIRELGEQCDDGNVTNLDGCSATCKFEQNQRINYFKLQFASDSTCSKDAFGVAMVGSTMQTQLQGYLDNSIQDGSMSGTLAMLGLIDLTGTNAASFNLGSVPGTVVSGSGYNGTSDLDWWYTADPNSLDSNRVPTQQMPASITSKQLTAGPGSVTLPFNFLGTLSNWRFSNTVLKATINASSQPTTSPNSMPPGHLPSENLDPSLASFLSMGQQNATGSGSLCGGISAASLAATPVPTLLISTNCSINYGINNSALDVMVGGCRTFLAPEINGTQPDTSDPSAPIAGAGPPYRLSASSTHQVIGCTDKNGATVDLATCLNSAAYSSYFRFAADRVIIK